MSKVGDAVLTIKKSVLLLVDIQEKFAPVISGMEGVVRNSLVLLRAAKRLKVPIMVSEQYPKALGRTVGELRLELEDSKVYFPKLSFSALGSDDLALTLRNTHRLQVVLAGVEAHVCVFQSAMALMDSGYKVFVVADAVSSRKEWERDLALRRLEKHGAELISTEMALFEWLKEAGTPEFKELQALIK